MLSERKFSSNDQRIADIVEKAFRSANQPTTSYVTNDDSSKRIRVDNDDYDYDDDSNETIAANCLSSSSRRFETVRLVLLAQYVTSILIVAVYGLFVTLKSTEHLRFYVIVQTTSTLCTVIAYLLSIEDDRDER